MNSKIEISRELLSHAAAILSSVHSDVAHQLTALLAAPVVERQTEAWLIQWGSTIPKFTGHREVVMVKPFFDPEAATVTALYTSPPAQVAVVLPEGYMIVERSIWTEEQAESAAKCITMLKNVPGMTDRDLALAAMDAGQCKAPEITLSDLACLDKVKELNGVVADGKARDV